MQWSRRETKTLKLQQATEELGRERTARVTTMAWCLTVANHIVEQIYKPRKMVKNVHMRQRRSAWP